MRFIRFLLPLLALCLMAGTSKPKVLVRFHVEVNEVSGAPFTMPAAVPGTDRKITLSKSAEISEDDIVAIFPFMSDDGTAGCAFRLNNHGKLALDTLSTEARGSMMIGFVNSRPVTAMMIDRRVPDGVIIIKQGLTPDELRLLAKAFPLLGQNQKKPAAKGKAPATPGAASQAAPTNAALPVGD